MRKLRSQKETEELVRISEHLQEVIGHGKYFTTLSEKDIEDIVGLLERLRQLTQAEFSESLKDGRMKLFVEGTMAPYIGKWEFTWLDDGYPRAVELPGSAELPIFLRLPLRAHVELRKRLYVYGFQYRSSESFDDYMEKNPGDGGIEFLENDGPKFIYPYARPYYLRFYPDWVDVTPPTGNEPAGGVL